MLASTVSSPLASRSESWGPSAAVKGEEGAKAVLCQQMENDEPHEEITVPSDVPM